MSNKFNYEKSVDVKSSSTLSKVVTDFLKSILQTKLNNWNKVIFIKMQTKLSYMMSFILDSPPHPPPHTTLTP